MLFDLSPLIVCEIIAPAREFHTKEGVVIPESINELSEEDSQRILADHQNDLTYLALKETIDDFKLDQQMQLVALPYSSRGNFSEWEASVSEAQAGWMTHTADYLLSKPQVADYLEVGFDMIGYGCEK